MNDHADTPSLSVGSSYVVSLASTPDDNSDGHITPFVTVTLKVEPNLTIMAASSHGYTVHRPAALTGSIREAANRTEMLAIAAVHLLYFNPPPNGTSAIFCGITDASDQEHRQFNITEADWKPVFDDIKMKYAERAGGQPYNGTDALPDDFLTWVGEEVCDFAREVVDGETPLGDIYSTLIDTATFLIAVAAPKAESVHYVITEVEQRAAAGYASFGPTPADLYCMQGLYESALDHADLYNPTDETMVNAIIEIAVEAVSLAEGIKTGREEIDPADA